MEKAAIFGGVYEKQEVIALPIRTCARESESFRQLEAAARDGGAALAARCRASGRKPVGVLGDRVPEELILAAGMVPVRLRAEYGDRPSPTDGILEYSFSPAAKSWFDDLVSGAAPVRPDALVLCDSEDVNNRLYYYLRELRRTEPERGIPQVYLLDLLFTRGEKYRRWNERACRRFAAALESWGGNPITEDALRDATARTNRRRRAVRALGALRTDDAPRLTGCEMLTALIASAFLEIDAYTELARRLAQEAACWPVVPGRRLYYSGSAQTDTAVYEALERAGAVVVGEDHGWGESRFAVDVPETGEPMAALADWTLSGPVPAQKGLVGDAVSELTRAVRRTRAEAVAFFSWQYEEAASWNVPSQKAALDAAGIPSAEFCKMPWPPRSGAAVTERVSERIGGGADHG